MGNNLKKINISPVLEIDAIKARIISKSFIKFANIDSYYHVYLKVHDKIISQFANKIDYK